MPVPALSDVPEDARILITGAAGFVGQALVRALVANALPTQQWILTDTVQAGVMPVGANILWVGGDLADPSLQRRLFAQPLHAVVHLAGLMSGRTEADVVLGERINLHAALDLLALCRAQHLQGGPRVRWLMTSSIAVYGTPLPERIDDQTPERPTLSYGTHKRMLELMLDDMSRRGELDGRALRLPGVVPRPVMPNGALSGFNSDLIREPLSGRDCVCPVSPEASLWLLSLPAALDALQRVLWMDLQTWRSVMGGTAGVALNAPAWPLQVQTLVQAMTALDPQVPARLRYAPRNDVQAQFGAWPLQASFERARRLGLPDERQTFAGDVQAFVRHLAGCLNPRPGGSFEPPSGS